MAKEEEVEIRRAPKMFPWMLTGGLLGVVIALVMGLFAPQDETLPANFVGLLLISFGALGLGLGALFAIVYDLISSRRARRAIANRVTE